MLEILACAFVLTVAGLLVSQIFRLAIPTIAVSKTSMSVGILVQIACAVVLTVGYGVIIERVILALLIALVVRFVIYFVLFSREFR